jgi:hypothetical protein
LFRHVNPLLRIGLLPFSKTIPQGAATQCYVAAHPAAAAITGQYFSNCRVSGVSHAAQDDELGERLWAVSENLLAQHGHHR